MDAQILLPLKCVNPVLLVAPNRTPKYRDYFLKTLPKYVPHLSLFRQRDSQPKLKT